MQNDRKEEIDRGEEKRGAGVVIVLRTAGSTAAERARCRSRLRQPGGVEIRVLGVESGGVVVGYK